MIEGYLTVYQLIHLEGSLFIYEWKSWMAGSAIGNCANGAYAVGVRSEDSAAIILNRIVHELIHGIDKNGQCRPDLHVEDSTGEVAKWMEILNCLRGQVILRYCWTIIREGPICIGCSGIWEKC